MAYQIANELEDTTTEAPLSAVYTSKSRAIRIARQLAKSPSFQVARIWVLDANGNGVWSAQCAQKGG